MLLSDLNISPYEADGYDPLQYDPHLELIVVIVKFNYSNKISFNLLENEIVLAKKYYHAKDQYSYSLRHHLLNTWISQFTNVPIDQLSFNRNNSGKKYLEGFPIHFNISKSNEYLAFAFGPIELGIDIESKKDITSYMPIVNQHFHQQEKELLKEDSSIKNFFTIWTRKEALIKASGKGINDDLKLIDTLSEGQEFNSKNYILNTYFSDEFLVSLAYESNYYGPINLCTYNIIEC